MDFSVKKEYTIVLNEQQAKDLAGDLYNYIMGYRGGSSGASRELLAWLGSRNEAKPSGDDKYGNQPPNPNEGIDAQW
jgi:hypothetical protein